MISVYAYPFDIESDKVSLCLPKGAQPLTVIFRQRDRRLVLYAKVNSAEALHVFHEFFILGTGHRFPDGVVGEHIATVEAGPYVWHVFSAPSP